jgi:hypothetical protein
VGLDGSYKCRDMGVKPRKESRDLSRSKIGKTSVATLKTESEDHSGIAGRKESAVAGDLGPPAERELDDSSAFWPNS